MLSQDVVVGTVATTSCGPGREYSVSVLGVKRLFFGGAIAPKNGAFVTTETPARQNSENHPQWGWL